MEVQGYAYIKKDANCEFAMGESSDWLGETVRVLEFNDDSQSILVINSKADKMATFNYDDMSNHFKCTELSGVLIPPGIQEPFRTMEAFKRQTRKGGYSPIVKHMVIENSLRKNEFSDEFLFQKQ